MGLDMYLYASEYIGGWKHSSGEDKKKFKAIAKTTGLKPTGESPSFTVRATVGYWRKANAIHNWFVQNVQNGKDDCQESHVTREQLGELRELCKQVLDSVETVEGELPNGTSYYPDGRVVEHKVPGAVVAQPGLAAAILPSKAGFFFGNTEYNEYYLDDLRDTVTIVDRVLSDKSLEGCDFYYKSSW